MGVSKTDQLGIDVLPTGEGFRLLQVRGFITIRNCETLRATLEGVKKQNVILEMSEVPYMDSAGLGVLLNGQMNAQKDGGQVILAGLTRRVRDLLQLTKTDSLFRIYETPEKAVLGGIKKAGA